MTEKQYGGNSSHGFKEKYSNSKYNLNQNSKKQENSFKEEKGNNDELSKEKIEKYKKAGKIARETINYIRPLIKPGMSLLEIAEKIEEKIKELGGKPAFPTNLSINEHAAHCTPLHNDDSKAHGLLKVDLGVHIDGCIADTSFSLDLENLDENKKLIQSSESALKEACKTIKLGIPIREIGKVIENSIKKEKFQPIQNLCGHSISEYELHSGITIPNYDNAQEKTILPGVYAIEPFSTTGLGSVKDGKPSTIYSLTKEGNVRDSFAREILQYIQEEYQTLPFCTRWLVKKFGSRAIIAMKRIEEAGLVHHYAQLIETGNGKVAQSENTIIITDTDKIITTE